MNYLALTLMVFATSAVQASPEILANSDLSVGIQQDDDNRNTLILKRKPIRGHEFPVRISVSTDSNGDLDLYEFRAAVGEGMKRWSRYTDEYEFYRYKLGIGELTVSNNEVEGLRYNQHKFKLIYVEPQVSFIINDELPIRVTLKGHLGLNVINDVSLADKHQELFGANFHESEYYGDGEVYDTGTAELGGLETGLEFKIDFLNSANISVYSHDESGVIKKTGISSTVTLPKYGPLKHTLLNFRSEVIEVDLHGQDDINRTRDYTGVGLQVDF
ncbi:MAG: hypothetical protein HON90_18030 [Halobacteriovoraceae bacterium]|nr:hypothetical protein [Halobacteriovoraceae bacterium]